MLMISRNDSISQSGQATSLWYRTAVTTAVIAAIFSLIIFSFLVVNYVQGRVVGTKQETQLENLKIEIRSRPDDEQLLSQIRQLDLRIRQQRIRRFDRSRKGGYLLVSSMAIFLLSLKCSDILRKKMPSPRLLENMSNEQVREARFARWAVTAGFVVLGSGALLLAIRPEIDFSAIGPVGASWPSIEEIGKNWPSFRGPSGLGISAYTNVPAKWNGKTAEGILWKTEVPLPGKNSPVVWEDRVFLSGGDPNGLQVFCYDTASGKLLWKGDLTSAVLKSNEEPFGVMEDTGFAAPTVVTDGRRVYAIFATGDIGCFDFEGNKVWEKSLGVPDNVYGYASSPTMYRNLFLIQYDQGSAEEEKSNLIALDGFSDQIVWQTKRPVSNSWSSPIIVKVEEQFQIITCADPWIIAYEPAKGVELWRLKCLSGDIAPSLIYAGGLIFAIEPYSKLVAIRPDGRGDVTETHIAWSVEEGGPDICSPVSNGKLIFLLTTEGVLSCCQVADGKRLWEHDFGEYFQASPSLVGNNVYLLSEKGVMYIIEAGQEYKQLARCELGEDSSGSPAFADGRIYIRGIENLYCIGNID